MNPAGLFGEATEVDAEVAMDLLGESDFEAPCPLCGELPDAVIPCHGMSITPDEDAERVCIVPGGMFGVPGMIVFDHGSVPEASDGEMAGGREQFDGTDIEIEGGDDGG